MGNQKHHSAEASRAAFPIEKAHGHDIQKICQCTYLAFVQNEESYKSWLALFMHATQLDTP